MRHLLFAGRIRSFSLHVFVVTLFAGLLGHGVAGDDSDGFGNDIFGDFNASNNLVFASGTLKEQLKARVLSELKYENLPLDDCLMALLKQLQREYPEQALPHVRMVDPELDRRVIPTCSPVYLLPDSRSSDHRNDFKSAFRW
ncbi:MAG: hypothetical protein ACI9TH_001794 [Kiritimatiellia bacterium]|jgi:hypothetical protein